MNKLYKIVLLIIIFILLSTYNPNKFYSVLEKKSTFLKIQNIEIINNFLIKKSEIKKRLDTIYNKNIFFINKNDIEQSLKGIDFLAKAEVKKKYPNTVVVKIVETKPIAILFRNKKKYLLDSSSNLITFKDNFDNLPTVFGDRAENNFIYFFNQLKKNKFSTKEIKNFYFFQIGRWDLELKNDKIIKFPNENVEDAIIKSIELLNRQDFENYNTIDLRVEGKIIVE